MPSIFLNEISVLPDFCSITYSVIHNLHKRNRERKVFCMKYVCQVCGYVHEGDEPPEKCSQCGAPKEKFTAQSGEGVTSLFAPESTSS